LGYRGNVKPSLFGESKQLVRYTVKSDAFFEIALTLYKVLTTALPLERCIWQVMVNFTPYTAPVALFRNSYPCMVLSRFGLTENLCTYLQTEVGLLRTAGEKLSGRGHGTSMSEM